MCLALPDELEVIKSRVDDPLNRKLAAYSSSSHRIKRITFCVLVFVFRLCPKRTMQCVHAPVMSNIAPPRDWIGKTSVCWVDEQTIYRRYIWPALN
jgi:hypothetical protein